jgi:segregation and condensation protein B
MTQEENDINIENFDQELYKIVETLLFMTDTPLPLSKIAKITEVEKTAKVKDVISKLQANYIESNSAMQIIEVGGGFQMATRPEYGRWVRKLYSERMTTRLSLAALETLAIIAYKQPLTRAEVEMVRGVDTIASLEKLVDRKLIKVTGRKETVGRPLLYGTTPEFLKAFGLKSLDDLPQIEDFEKLAKMPEQEELPGLGEDNETSSEADETVENTESDSTDGNSSENQPTSVPEEDSLEESEVNDNDSALETDEETEEEEDSEILENVLENDESEKE